MPLDKSCSLDAFKANVRAAYKEGKTAQGTQHVAIALSTLKRACGVADGDRKMSPKDIVAAGGASEGVMFRLGAMFEQNPGSDDDWFEKVAEYAHGAIAEASHCRVASYTKALLGKMSEFFGAPLTLGTYEETGHAVESKEKDVWVEWLLRLANAAEERSIPRLTRAMREFRSGAVLVPTKARDRYAAMFERFGFDMAIRTSSPRGAGTSRSAAPPQPQGDGKFRVFVDGADIKSGDGRAPKLTSKPSFPKRK